MRIYALCLLSILNVTVVTSENLLDFWRELKLTNNNGRTDITNTRDTEQDSNSVSDEEEWPRVKKSFPEREIQSPTNIDTTNAVANYDMPAVTFHRTAGLIHQQVELTNTGYYLEILLSEEECKHKPFIVGGPLYDDCYIFEQMHFHWGPDDYCGSEHRIDGKCHSTEVHMVFYRREYGSFEAATSYTDGVAVISFFGDVSEEDNPNFAELCQKLTEIQLPGSKALGSFKKEFEFVNVLFQQKEYFAFPGTLTTPPYQPCVTWIMYTNPFLLSSSQLDAFRQLKRKDGRDMINENDRPLQKFGNRPIVYPAFNKKFFVESHGSDSMSISVMNKFN